MDGDWRNLGSPGHCFISRPYKGLGCYIHLSEARKGFKTSNWRLVPLCWGTPQFKSWAEEGKGWTKNKRKRWERRKGLSWHQSWLGAVWFEYFESRITSIWMTSVKNKTVGVHVEYKDTQKLGHFSFGCTNLRAIVKSWFCCDLGCSSIHFTLSWQQKTSHVGIVPISESLHRKSWSGNSNLISRQFSYTDNEETSDDWSWNLNK